MGEIERPRKAAGRRAREAEDGESAKPDGDRDSEEQPDEMTETEQRPCRHIGRIERECLRIERSVSVSEQANETHLPMLDSDNLGRDLRVVPVPKKPTASDEHSHDQPECDQAVVGR